MKNEKLNFQNLKYKYRFFFTLNYFLKKVGINFTKVCIYSIKLDNFSPKRSKTDDFIVKECTMDDLHLFGKLEDRFLSDMQEGHILIGAFLNNEWIGYNWISFKPVEMEEVERFFHFDGAYLWRLYVKEHYREKGIAKRMLYFSLNKIKNNYKKNIVYAAAETSNIPSIKTIESCNFYRIGVINYSRVFLWKNFQANIEDNSVSFLEDLNND